MGLTIHYQIEAEAGVGAAEARRLVTEGRALAGRMWLRGELDEVGPLAWDRSTRKEATIWCGFPIRGRKGASVEEEVYPLEGFVFRVAVGRDCEPLWLGLCRYPATVETQLGQRETRLGDRWQFSRFSKTQYASLHGWEHFLRCHRAIIDLLAAWRGLGMAVRVTDEGSYWPRRSERVLRRNLEEMNGAIAAVAGRLKDRSEELGQTGVVAPIFGHRNFEGLEAEGAVRMGGKPSRL
jgi:hypothetical protein